MSIPVFMSCDNNFAPFAATTMASILSHTEEIVDFYIIDYGISDFNKKNLRNEAAFFSHFTLEFVIISNENFSGLKESTSISKAMYGRYWFADLKPEIDRAIYTDVDVIFVDDIKKLWEENFKSFAVAAVPSQRGRITNQYHDYKIKYGLSEDHTVMMSGLLIIDLKQWRELKISEKLFSVSESRGVFDQEAMNIVFDHDNYMHLSAKYCVIYKLFDDCYTEEEVRKLTEEQVIIHYPGGGDSKPWLSPHMSSSRYFWEMVPLTAFSEQIRAKAINKEEELVDYIEKYPQLIVYGAGNVGRLLIERLLAHKYNLAIVGVAVTRKEGNPTDIHDVSVRELREYSKYKETAIVIIATFDNLHKTIKYNLDQAGFRNYLTVNQNLYKDLYSNSSSIYNDIYSLKTEIRNLEEKVDCLRALFNYSLDIKGIPKTRGNLRLLQEADIILLSIFDNICKKHQIEYWLDYGTLLGAVRHQGFIPWDDDLDVGMRRVDYNRIGQIFLNELDSFGIRVNQGKGFGFLIIRLIYKNTAIQLDIWPYDDCWVNLPMERGKISDRIKSCNHMFYQKYPINRVQSGDLPFPQNELTHYVDELIKKSATGGTRVFFTGAEALPYQNPNIFEESVIFPLGNIRFESLNFPAPYKTKEYLELIYGDYLKFPDFKVMGHSNIKEKDMENIYQYKIELLEIVKYLEGRKHK